MNDNRPALTPRQTQILGFISSGYSSVEIGRLAGIAEETAKSHTKHILRALGARNRTHAVTRGFLLGLLPIDSPETTTEPVGPVVASSSGVRHLGF